MYCPTCGAGTTSGLKFCKRCGGSLSEPAGLAETASAGSRLTGPAWVVGLATTAIALGGLAIVISAAMDLLRPLRPGESLSYEPGPIAVTIIIFGSVTIFGIVAMFLRLFMRIVSGVQTEDRPAVLKKPVAGDYVAGQISAPPAGMSSVTEQTTRNFEHPRYREPRMHE